MTISIDASLSWVKDLVVTDWLDADEDKLRQLAADWRTMASALQKIQGKGESTTRSVRSHIDGQTNQSIGEFWKRFGGDCGQLDSLIGKCEAQADLLEGVAADVEFAKIAIIIELTALAITLIALAPTLATGAGAAAQAARIAVSRIAVKLIIERLKKFMMHRFVASVWKGAGLTGGLEAAVQAMEVYTGKRQGYDLGEIGEATLYGAIAGTVGGAYKWARPALPEGAMNWISVQGLRNRADVDGQAAMFAWTAMAPLRHTELKPDSVRRLPDVVPDAAVKGWGDVSAGVAKSWNNVTAQTNTAGFYDNFMQQLRAAAAAPGRPA